MKLVTIAGNSILRMVRDRSNLFFIFLLPVLLITVIGVVFGGGFEPRLAVVAVEAGELGEELVAAWEADDAITVRTDLTAAEIGDAIQRGNLEAGVVLPANYDELLRSGQDVTIEYLSGLNSGGLEIESLVTAPILEQSARVTAARFVSQETGESFEVGLVAAGTAATVIDTATVVVEGARESTSTVGQFELGAVQNLILFMFITSLAGSAALIQARRLGVSRRMLSTPTSSGLIVTGETFGRFSVAMVQGLFIVVVAAVAFAVNWGQPLGAGAIVVAFALVGTGAGMLIGSTFSNEEQAGGIGTFLGLGLGALGGCMVPLEVFSPTMRTIAHITPHAWALDGFSTLIRDDGSLVDVLPEIGVLLGFAVVLMTVATGMFRRTLTA